jgi:hypothetical protein
MVPLQDVSMKDDEEFVGEAPKGRKTIVAGFYIDTEDPTRTHFSPVFNSQVVEFKKEGIKIYATPVEARIAYESTKKK